MQTCTCTTCYALQLQLLLLLSEVRHWHRTRLRAGATPIIAELPSSRYQIRPTCPCWPRRSRRSASSSIHPRWVARACAVCMFLADVAWKTASSVLHRHLGRCRSLHMVQLCCSLCFPCSQRPSVRIHACAHYPALHRTVPGRTSGGDPVWATAAHGWRPALAHALAFCAPSQRALAYTQQPGCAGIPGTQRLPPAGRD